MRKMARAEDRLVPVEQSRRLHERLRAAGVASELVIRQGAGHAWPGWESDGELLARWFDSRLRARADTEPNAVIP